MRFLKGFSASMLALGIVGSAYAALPSSGNCSTFTVNGNALPPTGDQTKNIPGDSFQVKVSDFQATKSSGSSVNLSMQGVTNQFSGDNDNIQGAGSWYVIYRCDEANGQFVQLTDHNQSTTVAGTASNLTFTDGSLGTDPQSRYHYVGFGLLSTTTPAFGGPQPGTSVDSDTFSAALSRYVTATDTSKITWSDPVYAVADFRPVQELAISATPAVAAVNGVVGQASVSQTFSATIDATLVPSPSYQWSVSNLPAGLSTAVASAQLTLSGTYTTPGVYNTSVGVSAASSQTTQVPQTYTVLPQTIAFTAPAADLTSVQVGNVTSYDLTTENGMAAADSTNYEAVFTIASQTLAGSSTQVASIMGSKLVIDLSNETTTGQALSVTVNVADQCQDGGSCSSALLTTNTRTFTATTANEFKFQNSVLTAASAFAANPANINAYAQVRPGAASPEFNVGVEGQGSSLTSTWSVVTGSTAASQAVTSLSQLGLQFTTGSAGAVISEASAGSATGSVGATFVLDVAFTSPGSTPEATISTRIPFIVLDGLAPQPVSTPVFAEFNWNDSDGAGVLPIIAGAPRTLMVTYNKPLSQAPNATLVFADMSVLPGLSGTLQTDPREVHYSVDLSSLATKVAPTVQQDQLALSSIALDGNGQDVQPGPLSGFANSTSNVEYTNVAYRVTNPLKVSTLNVGTGLSANAAFSIALNKPATIVSGAAQSNLGASIVQTSLASGVSVIQLSPVTRFDYGSSGVTLVATRITASGLPLLNDSNAVGNQAVAVTIEADTYKPALLGEVSRTSSNSSTDVTFIATFDEALAGTCSATVGGSNANCVVNANTATASTQGLPYNRSLPVSLSVTDTAGNTTELSLNYVTLDETEVVAPVADSEAPFVLSLTPDLQDATSRSGLALIPVLKMEFSESVQGGTISIQRGGVSSASTVQGSGSFYQVNPNAQLEAGVSYNVEVQGFSDASNNTMNPVTYTFTTRQPSEVLPAPTMAGNSVDGQTLNVDSPLTFVFSESLSQDSLNSGFQLSSGGNAVTGNWSVSGKAHTFTPGADLSASSTYTYSFSTAVQSLRGVALSAAVTGGFATKAAAEPKEFAVNVSSEGSGYIATATWVPGSETGLSHYSVTYQVSNDLSFSGSETVLTTTPLGAGAARISTSGQLSNLTAGQNVRFTMHPVSTGGIEQATATATVLAVPGQNDTISKKLISVAGNKVATLAVEAAAGEAAPAAQLKVDPKALKTSSEFTIQSISDQGAKDRLNALGGGGRKVIDPVQFGPDGKTFRKPVEIGLRFNPATVGSNSASALSTMITPVFVDPRTGRWSQQGLALSRVEVVDGDEAVLYLLTSHFSAFSVGEALRFITDAGALSVVNNTASVSWSAAVTPGDLQISVSGTGESQVSTQAIVAAGSSENTTGFSVQIPEVITEDINLSYNVTIQDGTTTATRAFTLTRAQTGGDTEFTGTPRNVDTFSVKLTSAATHAQFSFGIDSDSEDRQIDSIQVEVAQKVISQTGASFTTPVTYSFNRSVVTTQITGLNDSSTYRYNVYTKSQKGNRSLSTGDITRFTYFGILTTTVAAGGARTLTGTDNVSVPFTVSGTTVEIARVSTGNLGDLTGTGKILASTTTLSNGQSFVQTGLFDLSFAGEGSVSITMAGTYTSGYVISHYDEAKGGWEYLGDGNGAPLQATLTSQGTNTVIKISASTASGSPFALARPLPVSADDGGGGCLSVAGNHTSAVHGWFNFLLMLLPLGILYLRRKV